jgi:hypothetical protein
MSNWIDAEKLQYGDIFKISRNSSLLYTVMATREGREGKELFLFQAPHAKTVWLSTGIVRIVWLIDSKMVCPFST